MKHFEMPIRDANGILVYIARFDYLSELIALVKDYKDFGYVLYDNNGYVLNEGKIECDILESIVSRWEVTWKFRDIAFDKIFGYGGYHFAPYGFLNARYGKDIQWIARYQVSDFGLGIMVDHYPQSRCAWSHRDFYEAAGGYDKVQEDLFLCLEIGHIYLPGENELFLWTGNVSKR